MSEMLAYKLISFQNKMIDNKRFKQAQINRGNDVYQKYLRH